MKHKWTDDERFMFATQKLRAQRIPNKKRAHNKRACRFRPTAE